MEFLILLVLILLNGLFSMAEISMVSARKTRLEQAAKKGSRKAKAALDLANKPNKLLSTVQIGITLIGILTGIYSGANITDNMEHLLLRVSFLAPYAHPIAVVTILIIITFFSLVLGELVPKRIGLSSPERIAKLTAQPMKIISIITAPFVWLLTVTSDLILKILSIKPSADSKVTEEEIKAIVQEGTEVGEVQEIEQDILERVFHVGDRKVSSLMTHRTDIITLDKDATAEEVRASVLQELHSVYPVVNETIDDVIGCVQLKDLFAHIRDEDFSLQKYVKTPVYIIEQTPAYKALEQFKSSQVHYAIVTDEYGMTQGILTLNDILEALVGNISEFYGEEFSLVRREDGSWLIDGLYPFPDFLRYFDLTELTNEYPHNTLSGLILHELGHIPKPGEIVMWMNFKFEIVDMDGVKIDKILIRKMG